MMSSTVDSSGMLMVLLMAPERNGCVAAIISRWPRQADRAAAAGGRQRAIENRQMLGLEPRRAFDGAGLVDVRNDLRGLLGRIVQAHQGLGHGVVDDLHDAAADQLLVLHQRQIGLDARGVAIHHEADGAGGRQHGGLRVLVAVLFAQRERRRPRTCAPPSAAPAGRSPPGSGAANRGACESRPASARGWRR